MDRNVFSMIAATVFLLTMIIATIQMQLSMIEKAAEEVETDFGAYSYPIAGSMYVINPGGAAGDNSKLGYLEKSNFKNRLGESPQYGCTLEKPSSNDLVPGYSESELLKVASTGSFEKQCPSSGTFYTELTLTVMRRESDNINPDSVEIYQNSYVASRLLGR